MSEKPISFSESMVHALLAGNKTQTRRPLAPQPPDDNDIDVGTYHQTVIDRHGDAQPGKETFGAYTKDGDWAIRCQFGRPGDKLWVREKWCAPHAYDHLPPRLIPPAARIHYASTEKLGGLLWRHSIHMPRWASRIVLDITGVHVERLMPHSIVRLANGTFDGGGTAMGSNAWQACMRRWVSVYGASSGSDNPWVWVIEFRLVQPR